MKQEYTVGEIAELFGINTQTLRYYDKIGLFKPDKVNERNNYRCYSIDQIYEFAAIRFYKTCGYSLEDINKHLRSRNWQHSIDVLQERYLKVKERLAALKKMEEAIRYRLEFIQKEKPQWQDHNIRRRFIEKRNFLPIGSETALYKSDLYYIYPTIVIYYPDKREFGSQIDVDIQDLNYLQEIPEGEFLCFYHIGPYSRIHQAHQKLLDHAKSKKLKVVDEFISVNQIDLLLERNQELFITDIQLRIL